MYGKHIADHMCLAICGKAVQVNFENLAHTVKRCCMKLYRLLQS